MSEIRDRAKKQLERAIERAVFKDKDEPFWMHRFIEAILSIPELAVVDREAELPEPPMVLPSQAEFAAKISLIGMVKKAQVGAQKGMREASWVKEEKDE